MRLMLGFIVLVLVIATAQATGVPEKYFPAVMVGFIVMWCLRGRQLKQKKKVLAETGTPNPNNALHVLDGVNDTLEVFSDKVAITPKKNASSIIIRGLKGTKTIPFTSITAIQFREADPINGYIQFTLLGGVESTGGMVAAISDENSCFFSDKYNALARQIKEYIESRIVALKSPAAISLLSMSDEIQKLAKLNADGILSDNEFVAAKKNLISQKNTS